MTTKITPAQRVGLMTLGTMIRIANAHRFAELRELGAVDPAAADAAITGAEPPHQPSGRSTRRWSCGHGRCRFASKSR